MDANAVLELYGPPPEQFTAARNQLAKAIKDTGDLAGSAEVKALHKPTIAAWLANRLVRIAPDQVDELTEFANYSARPTGPATVPGSGGSPPAGTSWSTDSSTSPRPTPPQMGE